MYSKGEAWMHPISAKHWGAFICLHQNLQCLRWKRNVFVDDLSVTIQLNDPSSTAYTHPLLARIISTQYYITGVQDGGWPPLFTDHTWPIFSFSLWGLPSTLQRAVSSSGVEPQSMTPLWPNLLHSELPSDTFEDLPYTVFGLGDTNHEKFCWAAKKLSRKLQSLGATEFYERGEGDEQHPLG